MIKLFQIGSGININREFLCFVYTCILDLVVVESMNISFGYFWT